MVETLESRALLAGDGLSAVYYDNADFSAIRVKRVDATANFDWGSGSPDASIAPDTFSVRWSGKVTPQYSETYTFITTTDESVRLWVNGQLLIDNTTPHTASVNSGTIALTAGQAYTIKMDFAEFTGPAVAHLRWSSASQLEQIIPQAALSSDAGAPTAPTGLAVNMKADTNVLLTWNASTDDVGVQAYNIYRDGVKIGVSTTTRFNDTGRTPGGTYTYTVKAFDGFNNLSADSTPLIVTTNAAGVNGLSAVYYDNSDLTAIRIKRTDRRVLCDWGLGSPDPSMGSDTFSIRWSGQVQPEFSEAYTFVAPSADGVRLWVNNQLVINDFSTGAGVRTSAPINLTAGQRYSMKMEYFNSTGLAAVQLQWRSPSQSLTVIPTGRLYADSANPSTPGNFRLASIGVSSAGIAWDASTDDILVQAYNVYRDGVKIGVTSGTTWSDTGLTAGQSYAYTVRAFDGYNNLSAAANTVNAVPSAAPSKPTGLTSTAKTSSTADISWNASTDDFGVTGYQVFRNGVFVGATATRTYHDTSLNGGTTYAYTVKATDASGNLSAASDSLNVTTDAPTGWWNASWHYRTALSASAGSYARSNLVVTRDINFTQILTGLGASGSVIDNSLRVIETSADGLTLLNAAVPFQFDKVAGYNASTNAAGTLVFKLTGTTNANTTRYYHVYFDTSGSFSAPSVPNDVTTTDNVTDEGQAAVRVVTAAATYYYQKANGGFSSIVDSSGQDWLGFNPAPGSGAGGEYRGVPNAVFPGGGFHPGFSNGSTQILAWGPLRATLLTTSMIDRGSGPQQWQMRWDIYGDHATCTVLQAPANYWFLYEGTPGGNLDTNGNDYVVRSDGTWTDANTAWNTNLGTGNGNEWVYFGDSAANKYFYLAHAQQDNVIDSYYNMNNQMTVFGFGRNGGNSYLSGANQQFTIGIAAGGAYGTAAPFINGVYKPVNVTLGGSQHT